MISRFPKKSFSRATFIPWSPVDGAEIPERGPICGTRKINYIASGMASADPKKTTGIVLKFGRKN